MDTIRTVIVDDEPLARRRIRQLLADTSGFVVEGECTNGAEAVAALSGDAALDLVFLDVQMPDFSGLQVLQQLSAFALPLVVFVTAYDRYMLQAFEAHAVDYLLKPLDPDRFSRCLAHLRHRIRQQRAGTVPPPWEALLRTLPPAPAATAFPTQLLIKQPGRLHFVPVAQVQYLEATGNYVTVHAQSEPHQLRSTLSQLERQLDPALFLRIHRSLIVNTQYIKELRPWTHGEYLLTLHNGTHLTSSRSCNESIQQFLKQFAS
ncbi:LytTR family DNA-binding domain-containing protein [Hymenobacter ginsengisoli]|uniref:LytTR family DNA-binding domain-containing protein n=1 Tax=Hymenobacter ginsengisoli TaxID=1051626 RepID=A0ABP8PVV1_9BACT|nr:MULTISPECIES: LytTR family DNA-binding domain-containing protein [unclassified Hymenobacter]MBO2033776.1 response regulator transcription factor [Hymenobacter sp. BT559]